MEEPSRPPDTLTSDRHFDRMVETLVANELATYSDADPFRHLHPQHSFLWIPRRPDSLSLGALMSLVKVNLAEGYNFLMNEHCSDMVVTPKKPYLMFGIEDGSAYLDTRPSLSEIRILHRGRSPYTLFEGIIHVMLFPETLTTHAMDLCGSRYKFEDVPSLSLAGDGPRLTSRMTDYAHPKWGVPSCLMRRDAVSLSV